MQREDAILQGLLELAEKTEVNNSYKIPYEITKETDMWFVMLPQWSHFLPPFAQRKIIFHIIRRGILYKMFRFKYQSMEYLSSLYR